MRRTCVLVTALLLGVCQANDEIASSNEAPQCENCLFLETFEEGWDSRWIHSKDEKYNGQAQLTTRANDGISNDHGLILPVSHRFYGITHKLPSPIDNDDGKTFVIQYELSLLDRIDCGGAYLKLLSEDSKFDASRLVDSTPYSVMFGPDKCGTTNKIHLIFRHKNKKTNKIEEKHLENSPPFPNDKLSHTYTLTVNSKQNEYSILVDGVVKKSGSLLEDFVPPFQPPKMIDDPEDVKPVDWVDSPKMADPSASKPIDWDEEQPMMIPDHSAVKPQNWLEDEPKLIPDTSAKKPEDWDDEEDGDFEPPMIPNPLCETAAGCGEWKPPMIKNPKYQGKWVPPMIDNPDYKGEWAPKKIENPEYYEENSPGSFTPIGAIALELWTTNKDLVFDNILISRDLEDAKRFAAVTWAQRHHIEKEKYKEEFGSNDGILNQISEVFAEHPLECSLGGAFVFMIVLFLFCRGSPIDATEAAVAAHKKDDDAAQPDDDDDVDDDGNGQINNNDNGDDGNGDDGGAGPSTAHDNNNNNNDNDDDGNVGGGVVEDEVAPEKQAAKPKQDDKPKKKGKKKD